MTTTCNNVAEPLYLPFAYNNVSSNVLAASSPGVELFVGTPGRKYSLWPSMSDYMLLANSGHCSSPDLSCLAVTGGTYDPDLSNTESLSVAVSWNGTIGDNDPSFYLFYNDVLSFEGSGRDNDTVVYGFPFVTDDGTEWAYSGELGLGPNSTFLQAAVDSGSAPSLSWGLWVGRHAIPNPQDGLLVVGGYDNARVANDFSTFPSRTDCSTCLQIQNLAWVTEAGTIPLMNDTTNNFQVFLNPFSEVVQIPTASWEAFGTATNGVYDEVLGRYTYPPAGVPAGNLTFTIKDGYTTSIPASELFGYRLEYDDNGQLQIENDTYQVAWVNPYTNSDANEAKYLYTWGGPFLTMNYLVLDIEGQQFRLSEAIRQDFGSEGGVFPVKLCEGTPPPVPIDDGVNIGAIVGGVVGGVAGILIILLAAFFFYRRRKRSRCTSNQRAATASEPTSYDPQGAAMGYNPVPMTHPHGMAMYPGQPGTGYPGMGQVNHINPYTQGHASYYSDTTTTAVQEMPSPENNPSEWKGSQVSSDVNASKSLSATLTSPIEVPERRD